MPAPLVPFRCYPTHHGNKGPDFAANLRVERWHIANGARKFVLPFFAGECSGIDHVAARRVASKDDLGSVVVALRGGFLLEEQVECLVHVIDVVGVVDTVLLLRQAILDERYSHVGVS